MKTTDASVERRLNWPSLVRAMALLPLLTVALLASCADGDGSGRDEGDRFRGLELWLKKSELSVVHPARMKWEMDGMPVERTVCTPLPPKDAKEVLGLVEVMWRPGTDTVLSIEFTWAQATLPRKGLRGTAEDTAKFGGSIGEAGQRFVTATKTLWDVQDAFCRRFLETKPEAFFEPKKWEWDAPVQDTEGLRWSANRSAGSYTVTYKCYQRTIGWSSAPLIQEIQEELLLGDDESAFSLFWSSECRLTIRPSTADALLLRKR